MKLAVLGAGAWGTALAGHLALRHDTVLWAREPALIADLRASHENARYLAGVALPATLLPLVTVGTAVAFGIGVAGGVASGRSAPPALPPGS